MPCWTAGTPRARGPTLVVSLLLLLCSCTNNDLTGYTTRGTPAPPGDDEIKPEESIADPKEPSVDPPGLTQALGTDLGHSATERGPTTLIPQAGMRRYARVCPHDECPDEIRYKVQPFLILDFQRVVVIDPVEVTITNQEGRVKWWEFPITVDLEPGEHCVVTINQWLPRGELADEEAGGITGRSDLIGSGDSPSHCRADEVAPLSAEFQRNERADCQSLPRVSLVSDGSRADDDEIFINVPACPHEQVLVQVRAGKLDLDEMRRVPPTDTNGLHVATEPRPADGTLRLLTVRVGWQAGPDGSGVVESPTARFPVSSTP